MGSQTQTPKSVYLALVLGVILIGTSAILVKVAAVPGVVSAFYRVFFATIALFSIGVFQKKLKQPTWKDARLIAIGGLAFAADLVMWNTAILLTSAATATLLANNSPLWVGLGALLIFREKLSLKYWLGLLIALAGMVTIIGSNAIQELQFNLGDLLAIGGSFLYAAYMLITQKARTNIDTLTLNLITMLTGTIVLLPAALIFQQPLTGFSNQTWMALLALALLPQTIGWLAINYAMGHIPAARVTVILLGQPVITAILGIIFLDEFLSVTTIIGGLMVLTGIYLVNQRTAIKPTPDAYTQPA